MALYYILVKIYNKNESEICHLFSMENSVGNINL